MLGTGVVACIAVLGYLLLSHDDVAIPSSDGRHHQSPPRKEVEGPPAVDHSDDVGAWVRELQRAGRVKFELAPDPQQKEDAGPDDPETAGAVDLDTVLVEARSRGPLTREEMATQVNLAESSRESAVKRVEAFRKTMNPQSLDDLREEARRMEYAVVCEERIRALRTGRYVVLTRAEADDVSHNVPLRDVSWQFIPMRRSGEALVILIPYDINAIPNLRDIRAFSKAIDAEIERLSKK